MPDVFGRMVADFHRDGLATEPRYERSDGETTPAHCAWYFASPAEWGPLERAALDAVASCSERASRGESRSDSAPVLDAGCGPGRALDPLAERGHAVLGLDESPGAVRVARAWTDEPAAVGDLATLPVGHGALGSALFLGTHVGAGGTVEAFRSLLAELDRAIGPGGRVVADLYDPTAVEDAELDAYLADRWLADGVATRRFRLRYDGDAGRWRTLLMASPAALQRLVAPTAWSVDSVERGADTRYLFVLERKGNRRRANREQRRAPTARRPPPSSTRDLPRSDPTS